LNPQTAEIDCEDDDEFVAREKRSRVFFQFREMGKARGTPRLN